MSEKYFKKYMKGIFNEYKKIEISLNEEKKKYLTNKYKESIEKNMMFSELNEYFSEIIYIDKYGIFDYFADKEFTVQYIYNLYYEKIPIRFYEIMNIQYSKFINYWELSEEKKIKDLVSLLSIYIKRWILKIRIIDNNNYIEYNSNNENKLINDLIKKYKNSEDKYIFLLEYVEINLVENNWP